MSEASVIRIKPYYYIHVLDNNTNVTRTEVGPCTYTRADHEKVVTAPEAMIMIPPRHYCIIQNPVLKDEKGEIVRERNGLVKLRQGDEEIRFAQDPFPLHPGEKLSGKVTPLQVVAPNTALRLKCIRDFVDENGKQFTAGDEWLFKGPGTYNPRIEVQVVQIQKAVIIKSNQALRLRAVKETVDANSKKRTTGEEWLIKATGAYLPSVEEEVVGIIDAYILTDKKALHLRANRTFEDAFGISRKAGQEWLVNLSMTETHIPDVYEQVVGEVKLTAVNNRQFAVVLNPWKDGRQLIGQRELRKGETSFFLKPGETLEGGIQNVYVLHEDEALLLKASETFLDAQEGKKERKAGDRWLLYGPRDYVPPIEVEIIEKRKKIPLDENEGIYVRDTQSGKVRIVKGESYMLQATEELWKKELPKIVEDLLQGKDGEAERDRTRAVAYRAPHNTAVQIYDYKEKKSRVIFGPELVMLGPDEQFTVIDLSGDKPKRPHMIKAIALLLGPDFMTDIVIVETADHARLSLKLSYNWHFDVDKSKPEDAAKIFQVPDFVGDSCKAIASRVRGAVAATSFDVFHRNSAKLIRSAVFGQDSQGKVNNKFVFSSNSLVITNIDIQSVEPVDQRTRDSLQKSVQLAIEITTKSQEAQARHENARFEQEALGRLDRQKINDQAEAERSRRKLITLQTETAAVESTGLSKSEAQARAESAKIEGEAAVTQAELQVQAQNLKATAELARLKAQQLVDLEHKKELNALEIYRSQQLALIEAKKFSDVVNEIGADTLRAISEAGPASQSALLKSLNLKSVMITDGSSPINLFNAANGLIAQEK